MALRTVVQKQTLADHAGIGIRRNIEEIHVGIFGIKRLNALLHSFLIVLELGGCGVPERSLEAAQTRIQDQVNEPERTERQVHDGPPPWYRCIELGDIAVPDMAGVFDFHILMQPLALSKQQPEAEHNTSQSKHGNIDAPAAVEKITHESPLVSYPYCDWNPGCYSGPRQPAQSRPRREREVMPP